MSARIDIINQALIFLGAETLTGLDDDSAQADIMNGIYDLSRDATLEAHEWSFAIRTFTPAQSTDPPAGNWTYTYPLPSNIIRLLEVSRGEPTGVVMNNEVPNNSLAHEVQGKNILTNEQIAFCTGIRRVEDEGIYSNLFSDAFSAKLATKSAMAITQSRTIMETMAGLYAGFIQEAKSRDGQQGTTRRFRSRWLTNARRGFYG